MLSQRAYHLSTQERIPTLSSMNNLDLDVLHNIFKLACTDGGATGASLSRTSKSMRAASASVRFHSVRLTSLYNICAFIVCYRRAHAEYQKPNVCHLLLAFLPGDCDAPQRKWRKWTDYSRDERNLAIQLANDHRDWELEKNIWNHKISRLLTHLLTLIAPSLRTLTVLQCPEIRLPLVNCTLPSLRELTLLADDRMFIRAQGGGSRVPFVNDPSDSNDAPAHSPDDEPPFPALTHLHIVCQGDKLHPWEQTLPLWALLAPALTHLRISQANSRIHEVVRRAVGIASPHGSAEADAPPTSVPSADLSFPKLRRLVVQRLAENAVQSGEIAQELWEISEQVEARGYAVGPRLVVLRSRAHDMWYWRARLPWEWVARMEGRGGGGCWEGHEEDEEAYTFERVWGLAVRSKAGEKVTEAGENDEAAARGKKRWWKKFRISRRHTA